MIKNVRSTITITDNTGKKVLKVMELSVPIIPLSEGEVSLQPLRAEEIMNRSFHIEDNVKLDQK